jgi:hypothetical protein
MPHRKSKIQPDWKLVEFRSIFEHTVQRGYLTPSGEIRDTEPTGFPPARLRLADKNEVAEIIRYLTD